MDWILIGLGAGAGSVLRYELGRRMTLNRSNFKMLATFGINLSGATLLGMVVSLSLNNLWWCLLADGFLGGFTTFSTFMVEGVMLIRCDQKTNALVYFVATVILGIVGFFFGGTVGGLILT